ncbi:hypothetical protein AURDEDRAFT_177688 [Auricularia subglabra TFB-10046 SS5]|uniref:Uncharacterized protein n=1 Tax=Auricularia subglabra (strain TFB-10046 / SS5) TaxID=717982 RepID=J0LA08_AURST|nr:hypothetical protein AURDEDRAFT_177688 [Auricularia subglabra TFB-10046 SS5]
MAAAPSLFDVLAPSATLLLVVGLRALSLRVHLPVWLLHPANSVVKIPREILVPLVLSPIPLLVIAALFDVAPPIGLTCPAPPPGALGRGARLSPDDCRLTIGHRRCKPTPSLRCSTAGPPSP